MYVAFRFGGRRGYNYDIQLLNTCFAGHTLCMCCVCQIVCNNLLGVFLCISEYMFGHVSTAVLSLHSMLIVIKLN